MPNSQLFWLFPLLTLVMSFIINWLILHLFPRWNLLDRPQDYGHKRPPIPYPGGIGLVVAFVITVLLFFPLSEQILGFLVSIGIIAAISFWDDRRRVHPLLRLVVQIVICVLIIMTGTSIVYLGNPFGETAFELPIWLSWLITGGWIIGMMNTTNWLDGVPGAASGTSTLAAVFLGALSLTPLVDQPDLAALCFAFAAANFGFFWFNIPPPKMLNGDTGAMTSGLIIAVLSIFSGGKMATAFLVLALPLFDAITVIFHRLRAGQSPLQGKDERHLHDQLKKRGFSERQILSLFLIVALFLGIAALFLKTAGKILFLLFLGLFVFVLSWQKSEKLKVQSTKETES